MSLKQQIETADERTQGSWSSKKSLHLYEMKFTNRDDAEKAFSNMQPHYIKVWENGSWAGIEQTTGQIPEYAETSNDAHMWVDEHRGGFSLCIMFSNQNQHDEMKKSLRIFFKDNEIHPITKTLNESELTRIRRLMKATHSVEMDVSNAVLTPDVITDFMNVALTMPQEQPTLYGDSLGKDGFCRVKGYFGSAAAAEKFADLIDLKVRKPLLALPDVSVPEPRVREFKSPILVVK